MTPMRSRTRLAVLCVFDDADVLVGVAPWYLDYSAMHGRVLRPLGSGEVCSDYLSVLCHPARKEAVVDALADYLVENALDDAPDALRWDLLELDGVDAEDRVMTDCWATLGLSGCTVDRRPRLSCWRLELPTEWDSYVASLGKRLRRDRAASGTRSDSAPSRVVLHAATRLDELPRAMDILVDLHQRRRKMLGEQGCFASPPFLGFYRDVVPELLRRGQVQLYWLEIDGKPAAAEYHLLGDGVLYVYQAGMDPDLLEHQPGNVINLMILRQAIERGYPGVRFPARRRAATRPASAPSRGPACRLAAVPPRAAAQLRHNLWLAGSNVKRVAQNGCGQGGRRRKTSDQVATNQSPVNAALETATPGPLLPRHVSRADVGLLAGDVERPPAGDRALLSSDCRRSGESVDRFPTRCSCGKSAGCRNVSSFISLDEAQRRVRRGYNSAALREHHLRRRLCRQLPAGHPLLIKQRIPCTYFVTVQNVLSGEPFPHDLVMGHRLRSEHAGAASGHGGGRHRDRRARLHPRRLGPDQRPAPVAL